MQTGTQREHHVEMQGEGSQLQAKEGPGTNSSSEPSEGTNPADVVIWGF